MEKEQRWPESQAIEEGDRSTIIIGHDLSSMYDLANIWLVIPSELQSKSKNFNARKGFVPPANYLRNELEAEVSIELEGTSLV